MSKPSQVFVASAIEALRNAELSGTASSDVRLGKSVYFSWDSKEGEVALTYASAPGDLVTLEAEVGAAPRWFTLNLDLGRDAFEPGDVLGLVTDTTADKGRDLSLFVRSTVDGKARDTAFDDPVVLQPERHVGTALHTLNTEDAMAGPERFHTLSLRLPKESFRLVIHDLRFFVIPAARGLRSVPRDLTSAAG